MPLAPPTPTGSKGTSCFGRGSSVEMRPVNVRLEKVSEILPRSCEVVFEFAEGHVKMPGGPEQLR